MDESASCNCATATAWRTDGRTNGLTDDKNTKHCHLNDIQRRNDNNCVAFARTTRGSTKRQDMIRHDKTRHSMPSYTSGKEAVVSARVIQQIMSHKTNFHGKQIIMRKIFPKKMLLQRRREMKGVTSGQQKPTQKTTQSNLEHKQNVRPISPYLRPGP